MGKYKKKTNRQRHDFLLTFFKPGQNLVLVNNFILEKRFSGNTEKWEVAIYTVDSFKRYFSYKQKHQVDNSESVLLPGLTNEDKT